MISALCKKSTWWVTSTTVLFFRAPLTHSCTNISNGQGQSTAIYSVGNLKHISYRIKFSNFTTAIDKLY